MEVANKKEYTITLRCVGVCLQDLLKFLKKYTEKPIIYNIETVSVIHHHLLMKSNVSLATLKKYRTLADSLNEYKGNSYISMSSLRVSEDAFLRYICKGQNVSCKKSLPSHIDYPIVKNMDKKLVQDYHEAFVKEKKENDLNYTTKKSFYEKMYFYLMQCGLVGKHEIPDGPHICYYYVKELGKPLPSANTIRFVKAQLDFIGNQKTKPLFECCEIYYNSLCSF